MKRKIIAILLLLTAALNLCGFKRVCKNSSFSIEFIDVGQGDCALVECDGHYMLIDGGDKSAGDRVYEVLEKKKVNHLDILAISHLHSDHIGGLSKALSYASKIDLAISNSDEPDSGGSEAFRELANQLRINGSKLTVPKEGDEFQLGSAVVEVVDVSSEEDNDSLVLLITYGKTRFLFTGDIEESAQRRISEKYWNEDDEPFEINVMKMPHHGAYTATLYRFLRTFMPDTVVISVGEDNRYGHPKEKTLDLLNSKTWHPEVYRTDKDGDVIVKSNGKRVSVKTSK